LDISLLVTIGLILFLCSIFQGTVGFAFNLFAIPLLVWNGLGLAEAIATTSLPIFFQAATSTYKLKSHIVLKDIAIGGGLRYLTLPIGIYILTLIESFDKDNIKQFIGVAILMVVIAQLFFKIKPKEHLHIVWSFIAFGISGIALGMVSMGGPPVVLWVMAHNWEASRVRAFLSALFFMASPLQIALLYYSFGHALSSFFLTGLAFFPVVILGTLLGVKLGSFLNAKVLRKIVISLLAITSLASIISPYL
jgi:uncharacterized membrane protein YfcA